METQKEIKEDFLDVDASIPGQNFCCISFLSPEKIIKKKELYIFNKFIKDLFENNKIEEIKDYSSENIVSKYSDFKYTNEETLTRKFTEENDHVTNVRGLKIRGVYDSQKEAQVRAKVLQRIDPNFNVFVGQVGYWLPWDPEPDSVGEQEYLESELNNLMQEYKKNQEQKDLFYNEQLQERKKNTQEQISSDESEEEEDIDNKNSENKELEKIMEDEDPWLKNKNKNN